MLIIPPPPLSIQVAQIPNPKVNQACPLTKSIYQAISKPDFEIRFSLNKSAIASEFAALTVKHKIRGNIASFNMGGSMGYGSFYLAPITKKSEETSETVENNLKPVFFNQNWQNINGSIKEAPTYLFIAGLGAEDWYSGQKGSRNQVLGDVMWKFKGCQ